MFRTTSVVYRTPLLLSAVLLSGCGGCFEGGDNLAKGAGESLSRAATDFGKGLGSGVDKGMSVMVEMSDDAVASGLSTTVAKQLPLDQHGVAIYLVAEKTLRTGVMAKAINSEGQEVGRTTVQAEFAADDAKYVEFHFDEHVDLQLTKKFVVELRDPVGEVDPPADAKTPNTKTETSVDSAAPTKSGDE